MTAGYRKPKQFLCATDFLYCTICHQPLNDRQNHPNPAIPNVPLCKGCNEDVEVMREKERSGQGNIGVRYAKIPVEVKFYPKRPRGRPSKDSLRPDTTGVEFVGPEACTIQAGDCGPDDCVECPENTPKPECSKKPGECAGSCATCSGEEEE